MRLNDSEQCSLVISLSLITLFFLIDNLSLTFIHSLQGSTSHALLKDVTIANLFTED